MFTNLAYPTEFGRNSPIEHNYVFGSHRQFEYPFHKAVVILWHSSGNPVCLELTPQYTLECHWRKIIGSQCASSGFQWSSSGVPVCSNYAN